MSIFRKCHIRLFLIVKVGDPFWLWLHFHSVFEFSPKSVFHYFGLSRARLEKCIIQSAQFFLEHLLYIFKIFKIWNLIFRFFRFQSQENRFFGLGTFLALFYFQKFINLFTVLQIFYKFWKMFHKSLSYEPSRQYGISPFSKTILK